MSKKQAHSGGTDAVKETRQALAVLKASFENLVEQGNMTEAERLAKDLTDTLGVPTDAMTPLLERFRSDMDRERAGVSDALRRAAEEGGCEFQARLPYVKVGCVDLREESPGKWTLSVLGAPLETVRTSRGVILGRRCIARIEEIELALKESDSFLVALSDARGALRGLATHPVPANLLMLLCSHGRSLKRLLASADHPECGNRLSRAQFGFLLSWIIQMPADRAVNAPRLGYQGASQHETPRLEWHITIPDRPEPRKICGSRKIVSITFAEEGGTR